MVHEQPTPDMKTREPADPLTREAIDWLIRLSEAPHDAGLRAAAEAWRRADADRAVAWGRAERAWSWLADPAPDPVGLDRRTAQRQRKPVGRRWLAGVGGAVGACLLMLYLPALLTSLRADYATATAELRKVVLDDGTTVELAPQTALDIRFTADRRAVVLLSGEAFFKVAADDSRPFDVEAGELAVRVTGTAFDVRLQDTAVSVSVEHGSVDARSSFPSSSSPVRLTAGDQLTVDRRSGVARRTTVVPGDVAAWREHRMFVENATVADVVDALRRYQPGWIVLADEGLGRQKVAGLYDLRDPDQALRILVGPFGGQVREMTPLLRIISGP